MAVKVVVGERGERSEYPKLMKSRHNDLIILFSAPGEGVTVRAGPYVPVGEHCGGWDMDCFEPFHGSITLSND